jgi:tetratricopeptide (TPR) repeat protein
VGDDLDIANLIAEEVGVPVMEAPSAGDSQAAHLSNLCVRLESAENAFDMLGQTAESSIEDLRSSYMDLATQLHPDKYTDTGADVQDQATEAFDKVRAAWESIETEEKRQKYIDHVILGKPTEEEEAMAEVTALLDAEADFKKGLAAFNAGRLSAAHKLFEAAATSAPDELEFCAYRSYTTFALNRQSDMEAANNAINDLKDILDANQSQQRRLDGGWVLLGRAYRELGDKDASKRCLVQALRYNPSNPDAPRELRRLEGKSAPQKGGGKEKKAGFFGKLFGKK